MRYFVVFEDGRRFGPADLATLSAWAAEGRINSDSVIENEENGSRGLARELPGVKFPSATDLLIKPDPQKPAQEASVSPQQHGLHTHASQLRESSVGGTAYNRNIDNGSAKMVQNAWIMVIVGFFVPCIAIAPFGIYTAGRALRMGNQDAKTPILVGWIVFALWIVAYAIIATPFIIAAIN